MGPIESDLDTIAAMAPTMAGAVKYLLKPSLWRRLRELAVLGDEAMVAVAETIH